MMRTLLAAVLGLTVMAAAWASPGPEEMMTDPVLETRARGLYAQLRCVICQSQSINDSDAHLAVDMRAVVRERLLAGDTDREILDYMQARYGDYVLMMPPVQANTALLWLTPLFVLLAGGGLALVYVRRQDRPVDEALDAEDEARAAKLLEDEGQA